VELSIRLSIFTLRQSVVLGAGPSGKIIRRVIRLLIGPIRPKPNPHTDTACYIPLTILLSATPHQGQAPVKDKNR